MDAGNSAANVSICLTKGWMLWARLSSLTAAAVLRVRGWGVSGGVGGEWVCWGWGVSVSICGGCVGMNMCSDRRTSLPHESRHTTLI